jgi:hypothetical protein
MGTPGGKRGRREEQEEKGAGRSRRRKAASTKLQHLYRREKGEKMGKEQPEGLTGKQCQPRKRSC